MAVSRAPAFWPRLLERPWRLEGNDGWEGPSKTQSLILPDAWALGPEPDQKSCSRPFDNKTRPTHSGRTLWSMQMAQLSLAERLGYGPEDRLLIVNCDNLGSSHSANVAIFRSMADGVATSAT